MAKKSDTPTESFLPVALDIEVRGEVVTSNADEFRQQVADWIGSFNTELVEDEHFVQAETDAKTLQNAEKAVKDAKTKALADAEQLNALFTLLDDTGEEIRQARLNLERQIKTKKEEVKADIVSEAAGSIRNGHGEHFRKDILGAIKGKRSITSIREAANVVAMEANGLIASNHKTLEAFVKNHGRELIPDRIKLELSNPETLLVELDRRVEVKRAEEERARLEAEAEAARKEAEAAKAAQKEESDDLFSEPEDVPQRVDTSDPEPTQAAPSDEEEMKAFKAAVMEAFKPLRAARQALTAQANIERATRFAEAVNAAWQELS